MAESAPSRASGLAMSCSQYDLVVWPCAGRSTDMWPEHPGETILCKSNLRSPVWREVFSSRQVGRYVYEEPKSRKTLRAQVPGYRLSCSGDPAEHRQVLKLRSGSISLLSFLLALLAGVVRWGESARALAYHSTPIWCLDWHITCRLPRQRIDNNSTISPL